MKGKGQTNKQANITTYKRYPLQNLLSEKSPLKRLLNFNEPLSTLQIVKRFFRNKHQHFGAPRHIPNATFPARVTGDVCI